MHKTLIIIPTYNESSNINKIINRINYLNNDYDILVIDDNSPDNTGMIVNEICLKNSNVKLIKQDGKYGLGKAYCLGFKYAIKNKYTKVIQIDADLSHNPNDIPRLVDMSKDYDIVIGSRYINGVSIVNWPISRLFLSYCANFYARKITGLKVKDCTSGFKCLSIDVLKSLNLDKINSHGYSFQIEVNYKSYINGYKIKEIPIIFKDRNTGKSKMSKKIILEAILVVPIMKIKSYFIND
tara:strand:- start:934 stop:1650 length:717 start_codon:yes stop_codon:yes gene_type:complete